MGAARGDAPAGRYGPWTEKHLPEPRADVKSKVKVKSQSAVGPAHYFNLHAQGAKG